MAKRDGFEEVVTDFEEVEGKKRQTKRDMRKRILRVAGIVGAVVVLLYLWNLVRTYDNYEVVNKVERQDSGMANFESFAGGILKYSSDGVAYMDSKNNYIWNQAFEMVTPRVHVCQDYVIIYDQGGTLLYIMSKDGHKKAIETPVPIQTAAVSKQGISAVLLKAEEAYRVKLFDKEGTELANGVFYREQKQFPVDIALSTDGTKLAVSLCDITAGQLHSTIEFYNFGSVGQNEIDNNVGTYTFEDTFIPEIEYLSEDRMLAIGDSKLVVFTGTQKPQVSKEIPLDKEVLSIFHTNKYVGVVTMNLEKAGARHIKVYDYNGGTVMENDTYLVYDVVEFLDNNEICVRNKTECELFTTHSIKKFSYTFQDELMKIMSRGDSQSYVFIMKETTEEVRLQ